MLDKEKFIKIKPTYIYIISILVFSSAGFFYGNSKFNFSEFESIVVLGTVGNKNIIPPQAVSEIVSKPSFLKGFDMSLCYGISGNTGIQKSQATYQIVSETTGILKLRANDLDWLKNIGEECLFKIIESINAQEIAYVANGRYVVNENINYLPIKKNQILNLTKIIGKPLIIEKPSLGNRIKYAVLGTIFGLLVAYGLSSLRKRS